MAFIGSKISYPWMFASNFSKLKKEIKGGKFQKSECSPCPYIQLAGVFEVVPPFRKTSRTTRQDSLWTFTYFHTISLTLTNALTLTCTLHSPRSTHSVKPREKRKGGREEEKKRGRFCLLRRSFLAGPSSNRRSQPFFFRQNRYLKTAAATWRLLLSSEAGSHRHRHSWSLARAHVMRDLPLLASSYHSFALVCPRIEP